MKRVTLFCAALMAAFLMLPAAQAQSAAQKAKDAVTDTTKTETKKGKARVKAAANNVSASDIADAKSKGMVWVNTGSGIFHKDGEFYGKTKQGSFMTEAAATKAGYREAKSEGVKGKPKTEAKKK